MNVSKLNIEVFVGEHIVLRRLDEVSISYHLKPYKRILLFDFLEHSVAEIHEISAVS